MQDNPFPPELRTASVVPRWSIVWTLTRDTVANHSFFVTFYAHQIAQLIMWQGDYALLMYRALTDDLDETITGDLPSPVKREIIDDRRAASYVATQMARRMGTIVAMRQYFEDRRPGLCEGADLIIKAADRLDALIFLMTERRLGNGVVAPAVSQMFNHLSNAWYALPADQDKLSLLWETRVVPSIKEHEANGGWGL